MKTLQSNFTTPEQSKRLLELGIPADSADLYCVVKNNYTALLDEDVVYSLLEQRMIQVSKTTYHQELKKGEDILPCWSFGRLVEIYEICFGAYFSYRYFRHTLMEDVLLKIEEQIDSIDFSKLE